VSADYESITSGKDFDNREFCCRTSPAALPGWGAIPSAFSRNACLILSSALRSDATYHLLPKQRGQHKGFGLFLLFFAGRALPIPPPPIQQPHSPPPPPPRMGASLLASSSARNRPGGFISASRRVTRSAASFRSAAFRALFQFGSSDFTIPRYALLPLLELVPPIGAERDKKGETKDVCAEDSTVGESKLVRARSSCFRACVTALKTSASRPLLLTSSAHENVVHVRLHPLGERRRSGGSGGGGGGRLGIFVPFRVHVEYGCSGNVMRRSRRRHRHCCCRHGHPRFVVNTNTAFSEESSSFSCSCSCCCWWWCCCHVVGVALLEIRARVFASLVTFHDKSLFFGSLERYAKAHQTQVVVVKSSWS
jgi:hypothetical protein